MKTHNPDSIEMIVFDWAGTMIDYGCMAPVAVFQEIFSKRGIKASLAMAREPMGMSKRDHVETMCNMPQICEQWQTSFGRSPDQSDIDDLYADFENNLMVSLPAYCEPIPGAVQVVKTLREQDIKIGSTTGYTRAMMDVVAPIAASKGYTPDAIVTAEDVKRGRPAPFMIWHNAILLDTYPLGRVAKVGDTVQDMREGQSAGVWTIGVLEGSSLLGLTSTEFSALNQTDLNDRLTTGRQVLLDAGAHFVIQHISNLPPLLIEINQRLQSGQKPTDLVILKNSTNISVSAKSMDPDPIPDNPYLLLTPGPLSTTKTVRAAMLRDWCTWDAEYNELVQEIRSNLQHLAAQDSNGLTCVLMQGSGTFAVESMLGSLLAHEDHLLILSNGAYGERIVQIAQRLNISHSVLRLPETQAPDLAIIESFMQSNSQATHCIVVHTETTTGMLNPVSKISALARNSGLIFLLDAMSSFGGIPIDMHMLGIDVLVSSANKCIQGVPGFGFVILEQNLIEQCRGRARSLSLDLYDQWITMQKGNGKWRFTSPTHTVRAFWQALLELKAEGGIAARANRYQESQKTLAKGMQALEFQALLPRACQSPIITSFHYPEDPGFEFQKFYNSLKDRGFVIYPGKVTDIDSFRIGTIGNVFLKDIQQLLEVISANRFWIA